MTSSESNRFEGIEGTTVFDGGQAKRGYGLNMMCHSLIKEAGRNEFQSDPESYMARFELTAEQRAAVREKDWLRLIELGGNIYYLAKLAGLYGLNMQDIGGAMSGMTTEEFKSMMRGGGRKPNV